MSSFSPDDWVRIIQAIGAVVAAVGVVVGVWKGRAIPGQVAAIHHETVIKPKMAAVRAAFEAQTTKGQS